MVQHEGAFDGREREKTVWEKVSLMTSRTSSVLSKLQVHFKAEEVLELLIGMWAF